MKTGFEKRWIGELSALGSLPVYMVATAALFLAGKIEASFSAIAGLAITMVLVYAIRLFHFRERPIPAKVESLLERLDGASFPSTHAARAGLLFSLLPLPKVFLGLVLLVVCISRVSLGKHHFTDVVAGALTGIAIGYAVL